MATRFQVATFTPTHPMLQTITLSAAVIARFPSLGEQPVVLPDRGELPDEAPRVILTTASGSELLSVSRARTDYHWTTEGDPPVPDSESLARAVAVLEIVLGQVGARPARLALLSTMGYRRWRSGHYVGEASRARWPQRRRRTVLRRTRVRGSRTAVCSDWRAACELVDTLEIRPHRRRWSSGVRSDSRARPQHPE